MPLREGPRSAYYRQLLQRYAEKYPSNFVDYQLAKGIVVVMRGDQTGVVAYREYDGPLYVVWDGTIIAERCSESDLSIVGHGNIYTTPKPTLCGMGRSYMRRHR